MSKKATLMDVAKLSEVSQATVSMILNKKDNVSFSREVVERVENAAQKLGYKFMADKDYRGIHKEKIIVLIAPNILNPYYLMLIQGVEKKAVEYGYSVFLCNMHHDKKVEEHYLKIIRHMNICGLLYMCNPSQECMRALDNIAKNVPIVIVNNREKELDIDTIEVDNTRLGSIMAEHLIELQHQYVGYITTSWENNQKQRLHCVEGFVDTFKKKNPNSKVIIKTPNKDTDTMSDYDTGYFMTREILCEHKGITAIVGMNDMIALGIYDALIDEKISIPAEMSVMGCDNTLISSVKKISLTSIEHFVICKGMDACDILLKKIAMRENNLMKSDTIKTYHVKYEPRLIVRKTTAYPKNNSI